MIAPTVNHVVGGRAQYSLCMNSAFRMASLRAMSLCFLAEAVGRGVGRPRYGLDRT
jgi:hypothetical protein